MWPQQPAQTTTTDNQSTTINHNSPRPPAMTTAVLSRTETWSLLSLSAACVAVLANTFQGDGEPLVASIAFSGLAFAACYALIRWLGPAFAARGFKGRDMGKLKQMEMYAASQL